MVAEKHSGSQGLKWEGNSIKRVENELNWIKSLTKSDIIGVRIGLQAICCNGQYSTSNDQFCDRSEISESDRISYALHIEFLDSLYKVRVSVNPYLYLCLWALFPLCFFSISNKTNVVKFLGFF